MNEILSTFLPSSYFYVLEISFFVVKFPVSEVIPVAFIFRDIHFRLSALHQLPVLIVYFGLCNVLSDPVFLKKLIIQCGFQIPAFSPFLYFPTAISVPSSEEYSSFHLPCLLLTFFSSLTILIHLGFAGSQ
jgi:hypothetical protein